MVHGCFCDGSFVSWFQGNLGAQSSASVSVTSDVISQSGGQAADLRSLHQLPLLLQGWVIVINYIS